MYESDQPYAKANQAMLSGVGKQAANLARPDNEADLICEALVREIGRGPRWCAVVDAWQAILTVRRMANDMKAEREHLSGMAGSQLSGGVVGRAG